MSAIAMSSGTTEFPVNAAVNARERFAAIVDLENVAIMDDGRVSLPEMRILLGAIGSRVPTCPCVATGINVLRPYHGPAPCPAVGLTLVKTEPDAADKALCEAA
jgi:hypothetical protein